MADQQNFQYYFKLADTIIKQASKEELAECSRLLALHVAHYQRLHGDIPLCDTLAILEANDVDQAKLVSDGMENLIGVLGSVLSGLGELKH